MRFQLVVLAVVLGLCSHLASAGYEQLRNSRLQADLNLQIRTIVDVAAKLEKVEKAFGDKTATKSETELITELAEILKQQQDDTSTIFSQSTAPNPDPEVPFTIPVIKAKEDVCASVKSLDLGAGAAAVKQLMADLKKNFPKGEKSAAPFETSISDGVFTNAECETVVSAESPKDTPSKGKRSSKEAGPDSVPSTTAPTALGPTFLEEAHQMRTRAELFGEVWGFVVSMTNTVYNAIRWERYPDGTNIFAQAPVNGAALTQDVYAIDYSPDPVGLGTMMLDYKAGISANIRNLMKLIPNAVAENSIVAWPEYGIASGIYFDAAYKALNLYSTRFTYGSIRYGGPELDQGLQNCPNLTDHQVTLQLHHIGCIAQAKKIYIVANMLMRPQKWSPFFYGESLFSKMFNVNVVFGPNGRVVQIYEKMYPVPAEAPIVTRATNIPERQLVTMNSKSFRTFVCYDIIFPAAYYKSDVKHWIFTTKWTSARDLISILVQQAFSRATKSVVVASNTNVPYAHGLHGGDFNDLVGTGSGIYIGGAAVKSHFGLIKGDTANRGFVLTHQINMLAAVEKAFPDDNVDLAQVRAALAVPATPKRKEVYFCVGANCPACNDPDITKCEKINLNTKKNPEFSLAAGDLTCHFKIKIHDFNIAKGPEYFIAQADLFKSDRYTRSCVFARLAGPSFRDWTKYSPATVGEASLARFEKVEVKGNNLGANTAVLPVVGVRGNAAQPVKPFPHGDAKYTSSWTAVQGDVHSTVLTAGQAADAEFGIMTVALQGVYQELP